jgi:hypothetical protein
MSVDFGLVPAPGFYYYANALRLTLDDQQRMAILSFGRRDEVAARLVDRIDVVMPMTALFGTFWSSSLPIQEVLDKYLQTAQIEAVAFPELGAQPETRQTFFGNVIFAAVGEGESSFDFYHLSPREVHLAKTQKKDMRIQPVVRVILSSVLTKHFFETLRPHAEHAHQARIAAERSTHVVSSR